MKKIIYFIPLLISLLTQGQQLKPTATIRVSGGSGGSTTDTTSLSRRIDRKERVFNVLDYGANNTGAADATTAIQNAINAANSNGGGQVYFPNGTYLIGGALQSSNSQLFIPISDASNPARNHITLRGESKPNMIPTGGGLAAGATATLATGNVILKSTVATGAVGAAVIGTGGSFNETFLTVENLAIQIKNNPSGAGPVVGGISYKSGGSLQCKNVTVYIDTSGYRSVYPAGNVSGIETPDNGAETFNYLENTLVIGLTNGYKVGEHTIINNAVAMVCYYAFNIKASHHTVTAARTGAYWCAYDIYVSGFCTLADFQIDTEWQNIGKWYDDIATIKDSANIGTGKVLYTITQAGVGKNNSKFVKSGGANIVGVSNDGGGPTPVVSSITSATNYNFYSQSTNSNSAATTYMENNRGSFSSYGGTMYGGSTNGSTLFGMTRADKLFVFADGASNLGMVVGTRPSQPLIFGTADAERMRITSTGSFLLRTTTDDGINHMQLNGTIKTTQYRLSALNTEPATSTSTGTTGEIRVTATGIYICTATNTWIKCVGATF